MATKKQLEYIKEYDKQNTIGKYLKLNKITDDDIIKHLEDKKFQTYIKELIRKDMNDCQK